MSAMQFLRDELLQQGVDVDAHEPHAAQAVEQSAGESTVKDEIIKSLSSTKLKNHDGGQMVSPSLNKDDQQKISQLFNQVHQLASDAKFVVVSRFLSPSAELF